MRVFSGVSLTLAAVVTLVAATGCSQMTRLTANRSFKAANQAYQAQDYRKASDLYEETLAANPDLSAAYFFLANSYDNQFRPGLKGQPENDAFLDKAVQNYKIAADRLLASETEDDKNLGKLSLEYLAAVYGAEKLNDPASAEPVWQRLIQLEPNEPANYFALARLYDEAGAYPEAEQMFLKARDIAPNDPAVYQQLANYYNNKGEFDKTMEALAQRAEREPTNPEAFFTISTYYWDNARRNASLRDAEKREQVEKGLAAVDKALSLKADYMEALVYKGLLLRIQATLERDRDKQLDLIKQAEALSAQADEIRKKRATGA
jgi:tetratricopeptide (TPR) repeat protein